MNMAASGVWQKNPSLAWREIEEETIIISPGESVMHELNGTGSLIWRNIDGHRTAEDLAALLAEEYEVSRETALADTFSLLEELCSRKLLLQAESGPGGERR